MTLYQQFAACLSLASLFVSGRASAQIPPELSPPYIAVCQAIHTILVANDMTRHQKLKNLLELQATAEAMVEGGCIPFFKKLEPDEKAELGALKRLETPLPPKK